MKYHNAKKGFTLIEILVVVTIIGILASITLLGLGPARRSAQDARRIADIRQVQTALEVYYNQNGFYPKVVAAADTVAAAQSAYGLLDGASYLNVNLPNDTVSTKAYGYSAIADGTKYILGAILDVTVPVGYRAPSYTGFIGMTANIAAYCQVTTGRVPYCVASP